VICSDDAALLEWRASCAVALLFKFVLDSTNIRLVKDHWVFYGGVDASRSLHDGSLADFGTVDLNGG